MKIVIAGGSGFIGNYLCKRWLAQGNQVTVLSREPKQNTNYNSVYWDGKNLGDWVKQLEGADLLLNLSGKSVNCRYTQKNKNAIYQSRIHSTQVLGKAIRQLKESPKLWINASSATIYNHTTGVANDEEGNNTGFDFSMNVCQQWEAAFNTSFTNLTRKVILRPAIVFGAEGGVLPYYKALAKLGLGGYQGNGNQYISFIHEEDLARIIEFTIENENIRGIINASVPHPVTNKTFMLKLREALSVPFGIPQPKWLLKFGAFFLGTETELLLKSRKVVSSKLKSLGFTFNYPTVDHLFANLIN